MVVYSSMKDSTAMLYHRMHGLLADTHEASIAPLHSIDDRVVSFPLTVSFKAISWRRLNRVSSQALCNSMSCECRLEGFVFRAV